jgi:hypothetical protein
MTVNAGNEDYAQPNPMTMLQPKRKADSMTKIKIAPMYQLKIELAGTKPPIRRRLLVRGDMTLDLLHAVIQLAMGWTNSHLHQFFIGKERYSDPRVGDGMDFDETHDHDETKTVLAEAVPQPKTQFGYEYDFGDSWEHVITVEKIHELGADVQDFAQCLDGARACPPDDCGGVGGYADLLKVIKNPKHKEHPSMMEWLGEEFDPAAFDLEKTNTYLRKLKWPHTTESQLRGVLMARDGC